MVERKRGRREEEEKMEMRRKRGWREEEEKMEMRRKRGWRRGGREGGG